MRCLTAEGSVAFLLTKESAAAAKEKAQEEVESEEDEVRTAGPATLGPEGDSCGTN